MYLKWSEGSDDRVEKFWKTGVEVQSNRQT